MKTSMPMRALSLAFLLLVGISSTDALACTSSNFAVVTLATCDCPAGTAPAGSYAIALPSDNYAAAGGASATDVNIQAAITAALLLCKDLLPGYQMVASTAMPIACDTANFYCGGFPSAFATATIGSTYSTGATADDTIGTFGTAVTSAAFAITGGSEYSTVSGYERRHSSIPIACPGTSLTTTGDTFITLEKCLIPDGDYMDAAVDATVGSVIACPIHKVCPTGKNAATGFITSAPVNCVTTAANGVPGVNDALASGGFFCPAGTYGTLGTTLAASITALTGEVACGVGSGPADTSPTTCTVLDGYYGAASATGVAPTACPGKLTGSAGTTLAAACTQVAPGYDLLVDVPKQDAPGTIDSLLAAITECAGVNTYCGGGGTIALVGSSTTLLTYEPVDKLTGSGVTATACPAGTGNSLTGAGAQGVNAKSLATGCVDLLPGYAFDGGDAAEKVIQTLISACAVDKYGCAGLAGLFVNYATADSITAIGASTGVTPSAYNALIISSSTQLTADVESVATGGLILAACPGGSSSTGTGALIDSCIVDLGYYVDHSNLNVPATCPVGKYCPGLGLVGVAGGLLNCPTGSDTPEGSGITNSNINACTLKEGFYIATGVLDTPVPCPASYICAGGGPVGTAGGSVACPTGSLNAACTSSAGGATTVNLTPASQPITVDVAAPTAAASPDVSVTNTVPSASSAASTVASMVVVTVAAMVAL